MKGSNLFWAWLSSRRLAAAAWLFCVLMSMVIFWLYGLPGEALCYLLCLCVTGSTLLAGIGFVRFRRKHRTLVQMEQGILVDLENLPEADSLIEEDYLRLVHRLVWEKRQDQAKADGALADRMAYYTLWVHQIKTPIAAMDLLLQAGQGKTTELEIELQKITQYVDMVLQYLRLDSDSRDLVLRACSLDDVVRQTVRKYAKVFILKKIRLVVEDTGQIVLSDEKWLAFLLEQLLSNALKYTSSGGTISLYWEGDGTLVLRDSGIGIASEDLPRVFDKGFTGQNGRMDKKASGIGLYLCRRVADLLGHTLTIASQQGKGTQVRIGLQRPRFEVE